MTPATIICNKQPADGKQRELLRKLFASPEFSLLKEVIAARCIVEQVDAMNTALYQDDNDIARVASENKRLEASRLNKVLDVLDDIGQSEEEWFTVKLEHRR